MSEENTKPTQIDEIIKALDFNLNNLDEARGMTMADVKDFLLDILGTVRDMWERFQSFFEEMDKLNKIKNDTKKDVVKDNVNKTELSRLYV